MYAPIAAAIAVLAFATVFAQENDSATLTAQALSNAGGAYGWAREQKVRSIYYSGLRGGEYYQAAAAAGFNCAINKTTGLDPNAPEPGLALHAEQARLAAAAGQKYVACVNFNSDAERKFTSKRYTPLVDAEGRTYPDTPSPLDTEFWNQSIKRRWLLLAEAARSAPITAAMIDFEMYGSEIVFYDRVGCLDYSDLAFNGFLKQETRFLGENGFLGAPKDRPRWLKDKGLEDKYVAYYRRTLEAICRDIEREVHKVNPNLILSFYSWDNKSHFYESCALGFGTPQMPVLLWPGTTYASGYKPTDVDDQVKRLREINAHAVFIPGLWLWQYHPDNLAANAYQCAAHAGGFWLYGIYSMWPETARKRNAPQMNAAEYWAALKQANDEIAALQKNPARQTALRVDSSRTLYIATDPLLHVSMRVFAESRFDKKAALQPLTPDAPAVPLDELPPAAPIRNVAVYRALGEAGKTIAFRVHSVRLGSFTNGTVASVIEPDQSKRLSAKTRIEKVIAEERVSVGETRDIKVACSQTGLYTLVTQPGHLCASAACDAPYFVVDIGKSGALHFMTRVQPMWFYVPKGVREFKLTGEGQGVERFNLKVISPTGQTVFQKEDIGARATFPIPVPDGQDAQPWLLHLDRPTHGVLEDVTISFSAEIPPFLSPAKERLLIPAK